MSTQIRAGKTNKIVLYFIIGFMLEIVHGLSMATIISATVSVLALVALLSIN